MPLAIHSPHSTNHAQSLLRVAFEISIFHVAVRGYKLAYQRSVVASVGRGEGGGVCDVWTSEEWGGGGGGEGGEMGRYGGRCVQWVRLAGNELTGARG